jgi:hypothetical protein
LLRAWQFHKLEEGGPRAGGLRRHRWNNGPW